MGKRSTKKRKNSKELHISIIRSIILFLFVLGFSFIIFKTNLLEPKVNELTASYISFNNKNTTDMLRINNIIKLSDKIGKSKFNYKQVTFNVEGNKDSYYEIVLYSLMNDIDEKYIYFQLEDNDKFFSNSLSKLESSEDGGKIVYQGQIKNSNKKTIRMWISKKYANKIGDSSFEVKIKSR